MPLRREEPASLNALERTKVSHGNKEPATETSSTRRRNTLVRIIRTDGWNWSACGLNTLEETYIACVILFVLSLYPKQALEARFALLYALAPINHAMIFYSILDLIKPS